MTSDQLDTVIAATELTDEQRSIVERADRNGRQQVREQLVYQSDGRSYFADLALRSTDRRGAREAGERLDRHWRQMAVIPRQETRQLPGTEFEYRINPNVTLGTGGEFAPPLWLNELFATAPRPGEIIQRLVREKGHEFSMPAGASSVNVPKIVKPGLLVNDVTPGSPIDNMDPETTPVKAETLLYAGESDWAIQTLDQSPAGARLDWVVFTDLGESLDAELEADLIQGKGEEAKEALGLLNIKNINEINNSGAVETKVMFPELGKAMAKVGIERKRPPDAWLMSTAKLAWLALTTDAESRPLVLTDNVGQEWPPASLAGVAIYLDDAIPRTVKGNQEPVFAVRADDFMLWHSPVRTMVLDEPLSGTLQVRFVLYRETASMLHRYPSGIAAVTGTGMVPASGF